MPSNLPISSVTEGQQRQPLVSIIVPVYCEEEVIEKFYARTKAMLTGLAPKYDHEIVFVNDGSTDRTLEILTGMARQDEHVRIVNFSRNFGHQSAITAGIDLAEGDVAAIIDSDLQDPPEVIPQMLAKWEEGFKVVYGVRTERQGESGFKLATASLFYRLMQSMSDTKMPLDAGDFRLIDRAVIDVIKQMREEHRYMRGMMAWVGFSQFGLKYQRDRRFAGETKYTLPKMVRLAANAVFSFSAKPLYLSMYLGLFVTLLSLAYMVWITVGALLFGAAVQGWTTLVVVVLFLGGVQLMTIGVLGQYVGRLFEQSKQRPLYIVGEIIGSTRAPQSAETTREIPRPGTSTLVSGYPGADSQ